MDTARFQDLEALVGELPPGFSLYDGRVVRGEGFIELLYNGPGFMSLMEAGGHNPKPGARYAVVCGFNASCLKEGRRRIQEAAEYFKQKAEDLVKQLSS